MVTNPLDNRSKTLRGAPNPRLTRKRLKHGNSAANDSGRFACVCFGVQSEKCAKPCFQHIFLLGGRVGRRSTILETREGSLVMGRFVRFTVVLSTF